MFTLPMNNRISVDFAHIIQQKNLTSKDMKRFTVSMTTKPNIFVTSALLVSAISEHLALTVTTIHQIDITVYIEKSIDFAHKLYLHSLN